jgi:hypothetical protein
MVVLRCSRCLKELLPTGIKGKVAMKGNNILVEVPELSEFLYSDPHDPEQDTLVCSDCKTVHKVFDE